VVRGRLRRPPDWGRLLARCDRPGVAASRSIRARLAGVEDLPPSYSIADAAALAEDAGLRLLVREECDDWLEQERTFYQHVIAQDSDEAEPALRLLAEEGRSLLPHSASVRRLLLVAGV
jgi:hypothetical protein